MRYSAPPIAPGEWLSTPPIERAHLQGRVTIILFWSIGSEASWVRIRQLEDLSADLEDTLAVVAVHSPRHASERDVDAVDRMVRRAGVRLAVVHDPDLATWARYDPGGWPSTVVIDHRGNVMGISHGTEDLDVLFEATSLAERLARARRIESDARLRPLPEPTLRRRSSDEGWSWPAGLCVLANGTVAVADSGNDRVVVCDLDQSAGTLQPRCVFHGLDSPSQICELGDGSLAVTEPTAGRVVRLLPSSAGDPNAQHRALIEGLVRPRGIVMDRDGSLVVSDAGADRLVRLMADGTTGPIAGSGRTGCTDGRAGRADLAQPVAVARSAQGIAFIDAASASLRILTDSGTVRTATGGRLDRHGLIDGAADAAVLHRPMDLVVLDDGRIVIADTGNHRLRLLEGRTMRTLGVVGLDQPEAIASLGDGTLIVADTGNHRLVMVDVAEHRVRALEFHEPERRPSPNRTGRDRVDPSAGSGWSPPRTVAASGTVISLDHPTAGQGPWEVTVTAAPPELLAAPVHVVRSTPGQPISVRVGVTGRGHVQVHSVGHDPATARVRFHRLDVLDA